MDELMQKLRFSPFIFPPKDKYTLYALLYFICTMYTFFWWWENTKSTRWRERESCMCLGGGKMKRRNMRSSLSLFHSLFLSFLFFLISPLALPCLLLLLMKVYKAKVKTRGIIFFRFNCFCFLCCSLSRRKILRR